jgi:hypothetical protein
LLDVSIGSIYKSIMRLSFRSLQAMVGEALQRGHSTLFLNHSVRHFLVAHQSVENISLATWRP